ncbi:complex I intermediate-associated protein CIA30 [Rhizoctonia solani AG-1 IA]|uniref:Complex I intermediate-associated protein CIA30 n=1 Tax=Thanatephorus cucumeris (strain AG1-IA) TaxID=983506 RepID=L8WQQ1_THACA|nr:complex I intermediate-associated protein CIA30 [Rhizoctonia solani AG-1 IA]
MSGPWTRAINRTAQVLRDNTARSTPPVVRMEGLSPNVEAKTLFSFRTPQDIQQYALGSDSDLGGNSTAHLDHHPDGYARFWGDMRLDVKAGLEGKLRPGYAGFRNKSRPTLFGQIYDDLSLHKYLALRVKAGGEPHTQNSYFVNIQTDGPVQSDLWQHRLYFQTDGEWEDIMVHTYISKHWVRMMREKIRTIGISILGGKSRTQGKYELGIESIRAMNEELEQGSSTKQFSEPAEKPLVQ